jgi:hypothetical protein
MAAPRCGNGAEASRCPQSLCLDPTGSSSARPNNPTRRMTPTRPYQLALTTHDRQRWRRCNGSERERERLIRSGEHEREHRQKMPGLRMVRTPPRQAAGTRPIMAPQEPRPATSTASGRNSAGKPSAKPRSLRDQTLRYAGGRGAGADSSDDSPDRAAVSNAPPRRFPHQLCPACRGTHKVIPRLRHHPGTAARC